MDMRRIIVAELLEHQPVSEIAKKYRVDPTVIYTLQKQVIESGRTEPRRIAGGESSLDIHDADFIKHLVNWKPTIT